MTSKDDGDRFRATVRLPRTDFPMKANLAALEPKLLQSWEEKGLYAAIMAKNARRPRFVLHDGPPYANGAIHHGHVLNKTLKDMVVKYRNMAGQLCNFVPGWDCHGLPIELNVDKSLGEEKLRKSTPEFRALCRAEAEKWINIQRQGFKRLGVLGAWERPYLTIHPTYEASVVRELSRFADGHGLYKGVKPVHWCWSDRTALAEAEVEHRAHTSPSIYVGFPITDEATRAALHPSLRGQKVSALIWTTTPWTLPANRALAVGPKRFQYTAYRVEGLEERVIMAAPLKDAVQAALRRQLSDGVEVDMAAVGPVNGKTTTMGADHPFLGPPGGALRVPFLPAEHVTLEQGTGLVHTAPGHGPDDFVLGRRFGLEIANPVDPAGYYGESVGRPELVGLHVAREKKGLQSANTAVLDLLSSLGRLLSPRELSISHEYPHCWRCKNPVIFRATEQWFISMDSTELRAKSLKAIEEVTWVPAWGVQRIRGMLEARPDWCISRQRSWGVPIPAFHCTACGHTVATKAAMEHVASIFETQGADAWWRLDPMQLTPPGLRCPGCQGQAFSLERDILDVWFESGASFAAVCDRPEQHEHLGLPADLYLEGSDQHRGWFHSTLLTAVGGRGVVPYRTVLTHGFVVDGQGHKYSKSSANFIPPDNTINKHGAEVLRLWVAATDYTTDIRISEEILTRLADSYRKIRNTLRFMLGNLHPDDFNPATDLVPRERLQVLDRYILLRLSDLIERVRTAYEEYQFHVVFHAVNEFVTVDLSSFYLDVLKDILYCDAHNGERRRSAQTALYHLTRGLLCLVAPILSFTADEAWGYLSDDGRKPWSVHLADMPVVADGYDRADRKDLAGQFEKLLKVRAEVQRALEKFRATGRHPLEAKVVLACPFELRDFLQGFAADLPLLFMVSSVELTEQTAAAEFSDAEGLPDLRLAVSQAPGSRCERCRTWSEEVGTHSKQPACCTRCAAVLG